MKPKYHIINGNLVEADNAQLHITDLAILRGYGIFDFFRIRQGKAIFIEHHLERFFRSAKIMNLEVPFTAEEIIGMINLLNEKNGLDKFSIRLQLTGGYAPDALTITQPNMFLMSQPFPEIPEAYRQNGVHVMTHQYQREFPEAKTINYLTGIRVAPMLREKGAQEVLFHDGTYIRESDRSNFFIVNQDGVLVTPKDKILWGVTRKVTLKIAPDILKTEERDITLEELRNAREMFVASSTKSILPVTKLDGKTVGHGTPGPVTLKLVEAFKAYLEGYLKA